MIKLRSAFISLVFLFSSVANPATVSLPNSDFNNYDLSSSSGAYSATPGAGVYVTPTNLSVTLKTNGRPVFIGVVPDGSANSAWIRSSRAASTTNQLFWRIRETAPGSSVIAGTTNLNNVPAVATVIVIANSFPWTIVVPAAGTYTWDFQIASTHADATVYGSYLKMIAMEL